MPTTQVDLTAPEFVADPYPVFAREPVDRFEPFNLLHRNQMMENEPLAGA